MVEECLSLSVDINRRNIYHLLRRAFCQCVTIPQVVHLNVLDVVAVGDVDLTIDVITRGRFVLPSC
jgi:hypothetical protein